MKLNWKPFALIVQWPWWPGDWNGLCLAPLIFVKDISDRKLVAHELTHASQTYRGLFIGFYIKYLLYTWRYGYWNNPYEIEARNRSGGAQ